jgi:hypothetical protein
MLEFVFWGRRIERGGGFCGFLFIRNKIPSLYSMCAIKLRVQLAEPLMTTSKSQRLGVPGESPGNSTYKRG